MKSRRQDLVLGIVVLAFLALFVGTILFVYPSLGGEMRNIQVRFKHDEGVAPLKPGSAVMLSGALQVGKVLGVGKEYVEVDTPSGRRQELLIVVEAEIAADLQLNRDCEITTDQPPVGGGGVLVILNVGRSSEPAAGPIDGMPPQSLAAAIGTLNRQLLGPEGLIPKIDRMLDNEQEGSLTYKISQSLSDVNVMTASLRTQLDVHEQAALMGKLHGIVDNLNQTTAALRNQMQADDQAAALAKVHVILGRLEQGLGDAAEMLRENRPLVHDTMVSVESMSRKMDEEMIDRLKAEFDRNDPTSLIGKIHISLDQINQSLENVVVMTGEGRKLVALNRPALERTIENMKAVSDQLRVGLQEILLAPWRLFNKPFTGEVEKVGAFEAARRFAEAATMLDDTTRRLQAMQNLASEDGADESTAEEIKRIQDSLRATFERFENAEQYLWDQMK